MFLLITWLACRTNVLFVNSCGKFRVVYLLIDLSLVDIAKNAVETERLLTQLTVCTIFIRYITQMLRKWFTKSVASRWRISLFVRLYSVHNGRPVLQHTRSALIMHTKLKIFSIANATMAVDRLCYYWPNRRTKVVPTISVTYIVLTSTILLNTTNRMHLWCNARENNVHCKHSVFLVFTINYDNTTPLPWINYCAFTQSKTWNGRLSSAVHWMGGR